MDITRRGIMAMATGGHKVILGLLDTDHLGPATGHEASESHGTRLFKAV